jgi:hypothetical protein
MSLQAAARWASSSSSSSSKALQAAVLEATMQGHLHRARAVLQAAPEAAKVMTSYL